jgi:autotransporter-associated beta strand protein
VTPIAALAEDFYLEPSHRLVLSSTNIVEGSHRGGSIDSPLPLPKLAEIYFEDHADLLWCAGTLCIADGAVVTFQEAGDRLRMTNDGFIGIGVGSKLVLRGHSQANGREIGGVIYSSGESRLMVGELFVDPWLGELEISDNHLNMPDSHGGAIGFSHVFSFDANLDSFSAINNSASGDGGFFYFNVPSGNGSDGGVCLQSISSTVLAGNRAGRDGGAVYGYLDNSPSTPNYLPITVRSYSGDVSIENNCAGTADALYQNGGSGGAIYAKHAPERQMQIYITSDYENVRILDNKAYDGGAVFAEGAEGGRFGVQIQAGKQLVIEGNEAVRKGGAVYLCDEVNPQLRIVAGKGGSISGNKAALDGGGTNTGGAFHLKRGSAPLGGDSDYSLWIETGGLLKIKDNTVGTGAGLIHRAIFIESAAPDGEPSGGITFRTSNTGGCIELHDGITAVITSTNTAGCDVSMTGSGTFAQIGQNAEVYIPGNTNVDENYEAKTHLLSGGARYQTYDKGGASFGSYNLRGEATLAAKGTGNVLASARYTFNPDSTLGFDLTGATPGVTGPALLTLDGGEVDTSNGGVFLGRNKVSLTGNVTALGNYYLLNATTITGPTSPVDIFNTPLSSSLTLNGNPVSEAGATPGDGGRVYAIATLSTETSGALTGKKLHVGIECVGGNIETLWKNRNDNCLWKAELNLSDGADWEGYVPLDSSGSTAKAKTFLNGDIVCFDATTPPASVVVDAVGVTVGSMVIDGSTKTFSGGSITGRTDSTVLHALNENALRSRVDGTLHIKGDSKVIFNGTIVDFAGKDSNAGIQVEGGLSGGQEANLSFEGGARLGASDAQKVRLNNGAGSNTAILSLNLDYDYTYKGEISGDGTVLKQGNNTLTFAAHQTFSGAFAVVGGTVVLKGYDLAAKAAGVYPGATLAGNGTVSVGGGVNVRGVDYANSFVMGTLSPGVGDGQTGKLTFGTERVKDNVTLHASAKLIVDIQGANVDLVEVNGDIRIENKNGSGVTLELGSIAGLVPAGAEYVILAAIGGTITGVTGSGNPTNLPADFDGTGILSANGIEFEVHKGDLLDSIGTKFGEKIFLRSPLGGTGTYAAPVVPEPSTYALCGALATLALALHRRHRRTRRAAVTRVSKPAPLEPAHPRSKKGAAEEETSSTTFRWVTPSNAAADRGANTRNAMEHDRGAGLETRATRRARGGVLEGGGAGMKESCFEI